VTLVVDASVALKWFLVDEPYRAEAKAVLGSGEALIAPDLIIAETCNAAWRGVRVGRMRQDQAEEMARSLPGMIDSLVASPLLAERAIVVAGQLDHAVYDCFYLALAEAYDASFVTADARLLGKLAETPWAARAQSLAEYRPAG
jgi:predicted nucleic acid-binding protein